MSNSTVRTNDERVLVFGDDGSAAADVAWLWVTNHRWPGWRAEVLTATDSPLAVPATPPEPVAWTSPHPRRLDPTSELTSVRSLTVAQDPRLMLEKQPADLIVVGPHRSPGRRGLHLGSTSEWLLMHPPAPLVIVRSATPVRDVVVCADGSDHSRAALAAFLALPWAKDTSIEVLAVFDGRADHQAAANDAVATCEAAGVSATWSIVRGAPTEVVLAHLEEHRPQLVVLGTRGLTGWNRLKLGSTAGAIGRAAPCSMFVACADPE